MAEPNTQIALIEIGKELVKMGKQINVTDSEKAEAATDLIRKLRSGSRKISDEEKALKATIKERVGEMAAVRKLLNLVTQEVLAKLTAYRANVAALEAAQRDAARTGELQAAVELSPEAGERALEDLAEQEQADQGGTRATRGWTATAHDRTIWDFEVIDGSQLPRSMLMMNPAAIRKALSEAIKETGEPPEVLGVRFYRKTSTVVR